MEAAAFLAYDEDIRNRTIGQWMEAHTTLGRPLHRYQGRIQLLQDCMLFSGIDNYTSEPVELMIPRGGIIQLFHGFDEIYNVTESKSLGLTWKPLRLTVMEGGERFIYLIINYRLGFSDNAAWLEYLKGWAGSI